MSNKTIALIDWSWQGHHPTYFTHFAAAIAKTGAEVVPFCGDPADFRQRLGGLGLGADVIGRVKAPEVVKEPTSSQFRPTRWRGYYDALRFFGGMGNRLRQWEKRHGRKIEFVFFGCIHDRTFEHFGFAERLFGFPWAGLYLHARSFRMPGSPIPYSVGLPCPEKIFSVPSLRATAVLDEAAIEPIKKISGGKPVVLFPDITVETLTPEALEHGLVRKIKAFAAGRPIVSLPGHLLWTKGMDVFTEAAAHPDLRDVCFFLGGEVVWYGFDDATQAKLLKVWDELPNLFVHLQHLPEETMNAVIAASDVVVAAYRSFPNSSNVLTKVAVFERPVVVSDGYLMGERVRRYNLGEIIPEGDADKLAAALRRMLQPGYREALQKRSRWQDYREAHSPDRLTAAFAELLGKV